MTPNTINKVISFTYWTMGLLPIIWMLFILANYLITGAELGRLPLYGKDGGQESYPMPYSGFLNIVLMTTSIWSIAVIPFILLGHLSIGILIKSFPRLTLRQALISYMGCGLLLLLWNWEPCSAMMNWYID